MVVVELGKDLENVKGMGIGIMEGMAFGNMVGMAFGNSPNSYS